MLQANKVTAESQYQGNIMFQFEFHNIDIDLPCNRLEFFFHDLKLLKVIFELFLFLTNTFSVRVSKFFSRIKTSWALLDVSFYFLCSNHSRHSRWEMVRFSILKDLQLSIWSCYKNSSSSLENVHSFRTTTFSIF